MNHVGVEPDLGIATPIVVIGVGHPYRRDDGVGPAVIDRLRQRGLRGCTLVDSDGEAAALIDAWHGRHLAILVDAVRAEPSHPGRVHRLVVPRPDTGRARAASSHGIDLGDAVELARVLDRLPDRMIMFAIEAADTSLGVGLCDAVTSAADRVADEIAAEVTAAVLAAAATPVDRI